MFVAVSSASGGSEGDHGVSQSSLGEKWTEAAPTLHEKPAVGNGRRLRRQTAFKLERKFCISGDFSVGTAPNLVTERNICFLFSEEACLPVLEKLFGFPISPRRKQVNVSP